MDIENRPKAWVHRIEIKVAADNTPGTEFTLGWDDRVLHVSPTAAGGVYLYILRRD